MNLLNSTRRVFATALLSVTLFFSITSFADDPTPEEVLQSQEQPRMKWLQKYRSEIYSPAKQQKVGAIKVQNIKQLLEQNMDAFILFHARDSELLYSVLDAASLVHPLHDEFMQSFAIVRTSSSAGFASGSGGDENRKPTLYRDPRSYLKHLMKIGLDVPRLAQGKEKVVALIGGPSGVQATGALATLVAAFKGHPQFRKIATNITQRYVIFKGSSHSQVSLKREVLLKTLRNSKDLQEDEIIDLLLQLDPENAINSSQLHGYLNWTGTSLGFTEEGDPIFETEVESAFALGKLYNILDAYSDENTQREMAPIIEARVKARRALLQKNTKSKPLEPQKNLRKFTQLPNANLARGDFVKLTSKSTEIFVVEWAGLDLYGNRYSMIKSLETGIKYNLAALNKETNQKYIDFGEEARRKGLLPSDFTFTVGKNKSYLVLPQSSSFFSILNGYFPHSHLYEEGTPNSYAEIKKKLWETPEKKVFLAKHKNGRRYIFTVYKAEDYQVPSYTYEPLGKSVFDWPQWNKSWEKSGFAEDFPGLETLLQMFVKNAKNGVYLISPGIGLFSDDFQFECVKGASTYSSNPEVVFSHYKNYSQRLGPQFTEILLRRMMK